MRAIRRSRRWIVIVVAGATLLVLPVIFLLSGHLLLRSRSATLRCVGRAALAGQVGLGMADERKLLGAIDAALAERAQAELWETMKIVVTGVHKLGPNEKGRFVKGVEQRLLRSRSMEFSHYIAGCWGSELSHGTVAAALRSHNPHARYGGSSIIVALSEDISPQVVVEMLDSALGEAKKSGDEELTADTLSLADFLGLWGFLQDHRQEILRFAQSRGQRLQRIARICLADLDKHDKKTEPREPKTEEKENPRSSGRVETWRGGGRVGE